MGCATYDYKSDLYGWRIFDNSKKHQMTPEEIDRITSYAIVAISTVMPQYSLIAAPRLLAQEPIMILYPGAFDCNLGTGKDELCVGTYDHNNVFEVSELSDCAAASSISHELAHWMMGQFDGRPDTKHERKEVWDAVEQADVWYCQDRCPDICGKDAEK